MEPKTGKLDVPLLMGLFEDLAHLGFYLYNFKVQSLAHDIMKNKNKNKKNLSLIILGTVSLSFSTSSFEEDFTVEGTSHSKKLMK